MEVQQEKAKVVKKYDIEEHFKEDKEYALHLLREVPNVGQVQVMKTEIRGFYVEVETKNRVVFLMYVHVIGRSGPCWLRDWLPAFIADREKEAAYSVVLAPFISHNGDAWCQKHEVGYMDRQGNYWFDFCQFHSRRTGFKPTIRNQAIMIYEGPRNKVPMPW